MESDNPNLPSESVNVIREDPHQKNILYVGTDQGGVYVSLDTGKTWYSLCCDLPTTAVHDIAIHPRDSELVIGTHGRSAFVLDVAPVQKFDGKITEKEAHLFAIRPAVLPQSRDYGGDWVWETQKEAVIHYYLKETCLVEISILDDNGEVVRELTGTNDSGVNRAVWDLSPKKEEADQAVFRRGTELVKPGNYTVVIQAGKNKLEGKIQVKPPR